MATYTDTEKFLQAVFGSDFGTRAIFAKGFPPGKGFRDAAKLDGTSDCFVSIAAFPDDGSGERTKVRATEVRILVVDDVTAATEFDVVFGLGRPTAIVRTSPGNFQWWYRLSKPVPKDAWEAFYAEKMTGIPHDPNSEDAVHIFRLPMGTNNKPGRGGCPVELIELSPGFELSVGDLMRFPMGPWPSKALAGGTGSDVKLGLDDLKTFMSWIPNTFGHRQEWMDAIHDIKALCEDDEDGFTVLEKWSDPEKYPGYNRVVWDKLGASGLKSTGGMLKGLAQAANPDGYARMFAPKVFDDGAEPLEVPPGRGRAQFKLGENDVILKTMENAAIGITALGIECSYDQFHHRVWLQKVDSTIEKLTDHAMLLLRVELNSTYGRDFGPVHVYDAVMALALLNGFNPVTDMLAEAEKAWDGVRRLDRLGPDYFHTEDTELARACFRKVMIAAVRRARQPGCKFDQILVTESPEGWDKSSAWEVLAGRDNFSDADILGKDARQVQEELADIWIHEIADLSGLARAEVERVKAFASRTNDRARPAYGRVLLDQLRQSVCVGTTNSDMYLLSQTGNRRFWPFKLSDRVELARLREDRLLLWGEAAVAESLGETLVLDRALWVVAGEEQEKRRVIDTWEDELVNLPEERMQDWWDGDQFISNLAIQEYLGGYRRQTFNSGSGRKIAEIMRRLGWEKCSRWMDGKPHRGYKRAKPVDVMPSVTDLKSGNPF